MPFVDSMTEWGLCLDVVQGEVVGTLDEGSVLEVVMAFVGGDSEGYWEFDVVPWIEVRYH